MILYIDKLFNFLTLHKAQNFFFMFFFFYFTLIKSQIKICVCDHKCSSTCQHDTFITTSNFSFKDFILDYIDKDDEIELNFYSYGGNFLFELDLSHFGFNKIFLQNLLNSKPIKVIIRKSDLTLDQISITPNKRILLPKYYFFVNFKR